ncbi:helix-turn-helix domain-containing protein [Pseudonocardia sp. RS010]|uniref:helix-turn-helix domain-containing protein n=1 Tax=Pseudonocardia sp. RS010 TaxID=3385979 RepID=UPI00399FE191
MGWFVHEFPDRTSLGPEADASRRVITCFDELLLGNASTRGLLGAAASLAGCAAGFRRDLPPRSLRVGPDGAVVEGRALPSPESSVGGDGITVWLEREGPARPEDAIILERLAFAVRIRHGRGGRDADDQHELRLLLDRAVPVEDRRTTAARLNLVPGARYRVLAAPLAAVRDDRAIGVADVVATPYGPVRALVVPQDHVPCGGGPCGVGVAAVVERLHHSFRTAVVALRLAAPPDAPCVLADRYGGVIGLLADTPLDADLPDVDALDEIMGHAWGAATLDALVRAGSVRQAARLAGVHHSTLHTRLETVTTVVGFDPFDGIGRTRLGLAYLLWRLRNSRVLDLPLPACSASSAG